MQTKNEQEFIIIQQEQQIQKLEHQLQKLQQSKPPQFSEQYRNQFSPNNTIQRIQEFTQIQKPILPNKLEVLNLISQNNQYNLLFSLFSCIDFLCESDMQKDKIQQQQNDQLCDLELKVKIASQIKQRSLLNEKQFNCPSSIPQPIQLQKQIPRNTSNLPIVTSRRSSCVIPQVLNSNDDQYLRKIKNIINGKFQ